MENATESIALCIYKLCRYWTALVTKAQKVVKRIIKIYTSSWMAQIQQIRPFSTE